MARSASMEGWWLESVRVLLGPLFLVNRNGATHKARHPMYRRSRARNRLIQRISAVLPDSMRWFGRGFG